MTIMDRAKLIGFNFKRLRIKSGLTPKEAAEAGGVIVNYIYQVQGGKVSFGTEAQDKWAEIFNCSFAEFFKDPENVEPEFPVELYDLLHKVVEVMTSTDEGCKLALQQNIHTFAEKVLEQSELRRLSKESFVDHSSLKYRGSSTV